VDDRRDRRAEEERQGRATITAESAAEVPLSQSSPPHAESDCEASQISGNPMPPGVTNVPSSLSRVLQTSDTHSSTTPTIHPSTGRTTPPMESITSAPTSVAPRRGGLTSRRSRASAPMSAGSPMRSSNVRMSASVGASSSSRPAEMCSAISSTTSRRRLRGKSRSSLSRRSR
jgi:hypothetical protein